MTRAIPPVILFKLISWDFKTGFIITIKGDHMKKFWIVVGVLCALTVSSAVFAEEEEAADDSAEANKIEKADWISQMNTVLPAELCKDATYFRSCFKITAEECNQLLGAATKGCTDKFAGEMPEILTQPADGEKWGGKVGECAGTDFETKNADKRTDTEKCNDASQW